MGHHGGGDEDIRTYIVYTCRIYRVFTRAHTHAGATDGQRMDTAHFTNEIVLLIVINVFLLIVGMVMDTTPAILILSPILLPIVQSIGMNPVHFGVVMIVNLAIGFVTPPIGVNLFVASSLTDVPVMRIAKKAAPMIGYFLLALLLLTFIPAISLCLL